MPVIDQNGYILATTGIVAGNHNDAYELKQTIKQVFHDLQRCGLEYAGAFFNADSSFDTREARKMLWNRGVIPNIDENKRNRNTVKRGRKRHFNRAVYKNRFAVERTFAWIDKFRSLLIRFERKDVYWLGFHYIAFTLINLRNIIVEV
ncbi:MAG: transposase [Pseudomonadota bacterium]|nr:transposase [Pseudomonadota bacterium]